ncbi:MAG: hypothetical protein HXY52_04960 [Nitrospirae bacterium]|jgi:hypothetical protein|nr:hypothetical protein [Nitrospirota bacterium]
MERLFKIGNKVKVGDKVGEIIRIDYRGSSTIVKVAFEEGPSKDFVCPPTKIEKILSPLEKIQNNNFDPPILFDLNYEANRLSLAYAYDHLLSLSFTRTNLEPYVINNVKCHIFTNLKCHIRCSMNTSNKPSEYLSALFLGIYFILYKFIFFISNSLA